MEGTPALRRQHEQRVGRCPWHSSTRTRHQADRCDGGIRAMIRRCLIVIAASFVVATSASAQAPSDEAAIVTWLQSFDRALVAKDLDKLAAFYHPDVTIFAGGGVNNGWVDYRNHHLGPELKAFENLQCEHRNIVVHLLDGGRSAYVTSEYALKARS